MTALAAVLILALIGLIWVRPADGENETIVTVFTATLTGLVGLFTPSPVAGREGGTGNSG
nr:hypothetical protein GCM10017745_44480 [Saccharothrix mutabilis subsp. capreolus]